MVLCYNEVMAIVTPQTDLILLQCPLEVDQQNQLTFTSYTEQENYFKSLNKIEVTDFTYQRKDGTVRFPAIFEDIRNYNYCMYKNANYSNKWFYCFITNSRYVNDNVTEIELKTDVWQTWQLSCHFKESYVIRHHVSNDSIGAHTIPEGLEYGEYVVNSKENIGSASGMNDCYFVVSVTELIGSMYTLWGATARIYNGLPQGTFLLAMAGDSYTEKYDNLKNLVRSYDAAGKSGCIMTMFVVPKSLVTTGNPITFPADAAGVKYSFSVYKLDSSTSVKTLMTKNIARNTTIDGYTPKNNKCFCAPYNYLMVTNNGGTDVSYAWEDFSGSSASFTMRGIVNEGCDIKLTPSNYKRTDLSGGYEWSISLQKFPSISWTSDFYLNWQAYNSQHLEIQTDLAMAKAGLGMIGSAVSGNIGGAFGGMADIASIAENQQHQITVAEMTPDTAKGNANTGDFNFTVGKTVFTAYKMSCKAEYIRTIDNFFSMFGYKVNRLTTPYLNNRRYWNYVKTGQCNVTANIPQEDLDEIKNMFNSGVTLWHDPSKFLDYSQDNAIVS